MEQSGLASCWMMTIQMRRWKICIEVKEGGKEKTSKR
jgi:hypothetical protein